MAIPQLEHKRILLTGGAGFLGRRVEAFLREAGAEEIIIPRRVECDLTDRSNIRALLAEHRPELIIHLAAAVGGIGANRAHPGRLFYENAVMGIELIEAARLAKTPKVLLVGTVCSYPKFTPVPFREDHLWDGYPEETNAPYGIAKKALLVQAQAYRREYGMKIVYLIPVNLYGPGDNFDPESSHVIPALIRKFVEAKETGADHVELWGTGSASREFLYVDDAAEGIVRGAACYDSGDPVNLGTGSEITIKKLAELLAGLCEYSGAIRWNTAMPDGQPRRCLETSRAKELFDFTAKTSFQEGLKQTVAWYLANKEKIK